MLVTKLETQFVTRDFFTLHSDGVKSEQGHLRASVDQLEKAEKERNDQLERRIKQLEDNQKWIVRLVLAAVIVAVLAAVGFSKSAGGA
jgi:CHASE3 domain sensor protein